MMGEVTLPVPTDNINNVTRKELSSLLSSVVRISQGDQRLADFTRKKPVWWPKGLAFASPKRDTRDAKACTLKTWTEVLRSVLKQCYKHHGQEHLLKGPRVKPINNKASTNHSAYSASSRKNSSPLKDVNNQQLNLPLRDASPLRNLTSNHNPSNTSDSTFQGLLTAQDQSTFRILSRDGSPLRLINKRSASPSKFENRSRESTPVKVVSATSYGRFCKQYTSSVPLSATPRHGIVPVPARLFRNKTAVINTSQLNKDLRSLQTSPGRRISPRLSGAKPLSYAEEDNPFVEIFVCFFCEREFKERVDLQHHQHSCALRPPELDADTLQPPLSPMARPPRLWLETPDSYQRAPKKLLLEVLGVLPKEKFSAFENQKKLTKIDCDVIDVEESSPKSPTTPRTPKSLISQLSREVSSPARRSLSLSDSFRKSVSIEESDVGDSDTESDCSKSDVSEGEIRMRRTKSLYTIDFSSPLGQRVKKHMCEPNNIGPGYVNIDKFCGNYNKFCQTPEKHLQDRLRSRGSGYTVSFKRTRRTDPKHYHLYKFTKKQRIEHYLTINTGLNRGSRALGRSMRKCHVHLERLSQREITRWAHPVRRRPSFIPLSEVDLTSWAGARPHFSDSDLDAEDAVFPATPGFLSNPSELQRLLGLKTKIDPKERGKSPAPPLDLSQVVSEDVNAEVNEQKVIVYRTVLSEMSRRPGHREEVETPEHALTINTSYTTELTPPSSPEEQLSEYGVELYPTGLYKSNMQDGTLAELSTKSSVLPGNKSNARHSILQVPNRTTDIRTPRKGSLCLKSGSCSNEAVSKGTRPLQFAKLEESKTKKKMPFDSGNATNQKNKEASNMSKGKLEKHFTKPVIQGKRKAAGKSLDRALIKSTLHRKQSKGLIELKSMITRQNSGSPASSTRLQKHTKAATPVSNPALNTANGKAKLETRSTNNGHKLKTGGEAKHKTVDLKKSATQPLKRAVGRQRSLSSSQGLRPTAKRQASDDSTDQRPAKQARKEDSLLSKSDIPALLFKCHLCHAEITCRANFKHFIKEHFASAHAVRSIHLVEQISSSGETVLSIIEDTVTPEKKKPASSQVCRNRALSLPDAQVSPATKKMLSKFARSQSVVQRKLFDNKTRNSPGGRSLRSVSKNPWGKQELKTSKRLLLRTKSQPCDGRSEDDMTWVGAE